MNDYLESSKETFIEYKQICSKIVLTLNEAELKETHKEIRYS